MFNTFRQFFLAIGGIRRDPLTKLLVGPDGPIGAGVQILNSGTAGQDSGWVPYETGMRLAYALDSGTALTTFSVDISADGVTSLGQAYTGTWASTTAEISMPIWLTNPAARFIRFNVVTAGPLSVIKL